MEVMKYILTVLEMDETKAEGLAEAGCSTPKLLLRMSEANFYGLYKAKKVTNIEYDVLCVFRLFLKDLVKKRTPLPYALDDWESFFTPDVLDAWYVELGEIDAEDEELNEAVAEVEREEKFADPDDDDVDVDDDDDDDDDEVEDVGIPKQVSFGPKPTPSVAGSIAGSHGKKMVKVSLSDFPTFSGKQEEWMPFSKDVMSTMSLLHLDFLLDVKTEEDVAKHLKLRKSDEEYNTTG